MKGLYGIHLIVLSLLCPCRGMGTSNNDDIQTIVKQVLKDVSQLTGYIQGQEIRLVGRIEGLERRTRERIEALARQVARQEVKVTERIEKIETRLIERVQGVETEMTERIRLQEIELTERMRFHELRLSEQIKELNSNTTGQLKREEVKLMKKIRSQNERLEVVEKYIHGCERDVSLGIRNLTLKMDGVKHILTGVLPGKTKQTAAPSCKWLDEHFFNLKNGVYWTAGKEEPKAEYCDMESSKVTTPIPTTTLPTTIRPVTTATPGTKKHPGASCKALKENNKNLKSGMYWILLGNSTEVFCDMETGRGGWTMVGQAVVEEESQKDEVAYRKLLSNDITKLKDVTNKRFLLGTRGLNALNKYISFKEIRFFCYKPWHGRTFHIRTKNNSKGEAVVDLMLEKSKLRAPSCDSFERFSDDNSQLGSSCSEWFLERWNDVGVRSRGAKMYDFPMIIDGESGTDFALTSFAVECDDYREQSGFSSVGKWAFYVR